MILYFFPTVIVRSEISVDFSSARFVSVVVVKKISSHKIAVIINNYTDLKCKFSVYLPWIFRRLCESIAARWLQPINVPFFFPVNFPCAWISVCSHQCAGYIIMRRCLCRWSDKIVLFPNTEREKKMLEKSPKKHTWLLFR